MSTLKKLCFTGDVTISDVLASHRQAVYDGLISVLSEKSKDPELEEVHILTVLINHVEFKVRLTKDRFVVGLKNAISFYEEREEYEKCQQCMNLISDLH